MKVLQCFLQNDVYFESFFYPDGMPQVRWRPEHLAALWNADQVRIIADMWTPGDVVKLALLHDAIEGQTRAPIQVIMPYLPFARADRRFCTGDCEGLRVFRDLLTEISEIIALDVHAPRATWGVRSVQPDLLMHQAVLDAAGSSDQITVVYPDAGARERYAPLPVRLGNNRREVQIAIAQCSKTRDERTGKLTDITVPDIDPNTPAIILDDICDGGSTFLSIAEQCSKNSPRPANLSLFVTHGLFSAGFTDLRRYFNHIYTTNTRRPVGPRGYLTIYDGLPLLLEAAESNKKAASGV